MQIGTLKMSSCLRIHAKPLCEEVVKCLSNKLSVLKLEFHKKKLSHEAYFVLQISQILELTATRRVSCWYGRVKLSTSTAETQTTSVLLMWCSAPWSFDRRVKMTSWMLASPISPFLIKTSPCMWIWPVVGWVIICCLQFLPVCIVYIIEDSQLDGAISILIALCQLWPRPLVIILLFKYTEFADHIVTN